MGLLVLPEHMYFLLVLEDLNFHVILGTDAGIQKERYVNTREK